MLNFLRRTSHAAAHRWRLLARADDGFTIIEVVMSAAIVVLVTGGVLTGLDAAGRSSADLRHRSQAQELAHQDQQRLRGMSALQLSGLDETRPVTVDGTTFSVRSEGEFQSAAGGAGCGSNNAAYVKVVTTVDWQPLNRREKVVVQSVITPPIGGTMIARVKDQNDLGLSGVAVSAEGPERFSGVTDSDGCVIFTAMAVGDYTVTASRAGYVDPDGNTSTSAIARATTSDTTVPQLSQLGQAGAVNASFNTRVDGTGSPCATAPNYCTDQRAPSLSWSNANSLGGVPQGPMPAASPNGSTTIRTAPGSALTLFPFSSGGSYTNNWTVWGGRCDVAKPPPTSTVSFATVQAGSTATPFVRLPALIIKVTYGGTSSYVVPNRIRIRDACGQVVEPEVRPGPANNTTGTVYNRLGSLNYPGQPYAPSTNLGTATNQSRVCVEYDPPGDVTLRRAEANQANTNFTTGTTRQFNLTSTSTGGSCPF